MQLPNVLPRLREALKEDAAKSDITTKSIPRMKQGRLSARLIAKQSGILAGGSLVPSIFRLLDRRARVAVLKNEGSALRPGQTVARFPRPRPRSWAVNA